MSVSRDRMSRSERAILSALVRHAALPDGRDSLSGVEIARSVEETTRGAVRIRPGGLYTTLSRLAIKGLIRPVGTGQGRVGKLYQLTPVGVARLQAGKPQVAEFWSAGSKIRGAFGEYEIEERLDWRCFDRSEVYLARISKLIRGARLPKGTTLGTPVMVKSVLTSLPSDAVLSWGEQGLIAYFEVVNPALKNEFDALQRLNGLSCVPWTIDIGERKVDLGGKAQASAAFIVQEVVQGEPLFRFLKNRYGSEGDFRGIAASEWFDLAERLALGVKTVHDFGTFHRHIRPTNVVMRDGQPVFCDLGDAVFRKADFILPLRDDRGHAYAAPEQGSRPLLPSRRADVYSLGGLMFRIGVGRAPKLKGVVNDEAIKRAVFEDLMAVPNRLIRQNLGIADIISRCLRVNLETRVGTAGAILQDVRLFSHLGEPVNFSTIRGLIGELHTIQTSRGDEVFRALAAVDISEIEDRLHGLINGRAVIEGDRDAIALKLSRYLSTLRSGDHYRTVSRVQFWHRRNLAPRGRYLSMNQELARRGVSIRRVFLLTPSDRTRPESYEILHAHIEAQRFLAESMPKAANNMQTRFLTISDEHLEAIMNRGDQKGVWLSGTSAVELRPVYDSTGLIRLVDIHRIAIEVVDDWFDRFWRKATVLDENWVTNDSLATVSLHKEQVNGHSTHRR